jgi:outer membrane protein assembly factor BamB
VSITDGQVLWETRENWYAIGSDPGGTRFYLGGSGLTSVDAASGKVLWTSPLQAAEVTSDRRHVYFQRARSVECLDAATGRKLWSVHLPGVAGRPVRAGGLLYVAGEKSLAIMDAATGRAEKSGISGNLYHAPLIAGGRLFVTDGDQLRVYY